MIVSFDIINNNNRIRCHSLGFCNVIGTFIYLKTIKLAIATTSVVNVRVPFNFTTWNKVVYTSGYVITYIIKTTEPNHLVLILNLANKSYFIKKVNFSHLLTWFKNYDPLKVGVNSFWDTLYIHYCCWRQVVCGSLPTDGYWSFWSCLFNLINYLTDLYHLFWFSHALFGVSHCLRLVKVKLLGHPQIFLVCSVSNSDWMGDVILCLRCIDLYHTIHTQNDVFCRQLICMEAIKNWRDVALQSQHNKRKV